MKKITKFLIYIIFVIILQLRVVDAAVDRGYASSNYHNDCEKNGTCLLMCAYTNNYNNVITLSSYIYYDYDSNMFFADWIDSTDNLSKAIHSTYLGDSRVSLGNGVTNSLANGICPSKSYVDTSWNPEVCFDDDDGYCIGHKKFTGTSSLDYNYQTKIERVFSNFNLALLQISCDQFKDNYNSLKINMLNALSEFSYNGTYPSFISGSATYKEGIDNISDTIDNKYNVCHKQIIELHENGELTDDEAEELLDDVKKAYESLKGQVSDASSSVSASSSNPSIPTHDCESLFGDPYQGGKNASPAYYMSFAFKIIRYAAIIILIVFSISDFVSAVASQDDDELKKAMNKTIKRLVLCVLIFLLPMLIQFILEYLNDISLEKCINTRM